MNFAADSTWFHEQFCRFSLLSFMTEVLQYSADCDGIGFQPEIWDRKNTNWLVYKFPYERLIFNDVRQPIEIQFI